MLFATFPLFNLFLFQRLDGFFTPSRLFLGCLLGVQPLFEQAGNPANQLGLQPNSELVQQADDGHPGVINVETHVEIGNLGNRGDPILLALLPHFDCLIAEVVDGDAQPGHADNLLQYVGLEQRQAVLGHEVLQAQLVLLIVQLPLRRLGVRCAQSHCDLQLLDLHFDVCHQPGYY